MLAFIPSPTQAFHGRCTLLFIIITVYQEANLIFITTHTTYKDCTTYKKPEADKKVYTKKLKENRNRFSQNIVARFDLKT